MIKRMYTIKDEQKGYTVPFEGYSDGDVRRSFIQEIRNPASLLNKARQDFSLWYIGTFDDTECELIKDKMKLIEKGANIGDE